MLLALLLCYGVHAMLYGLRPIFSISVSTDQFRISGHAFLALLCVILLTGVGILYIRTFLWIQFLFDRIQPGKLMMLLLLFLGVGGFGFFFPLMGGSGSELFCGLMWLYSIRQLLFLFFSKFFFSIFTLTCGIPGGFILPILAIGGIGGKLFGEFCCLYGWIQLDEINCFILYGMCAIFVCVVRMPITGIFLILETTWQIQCLPNLLLSGLTAYYL